MTIDKKRNIRTLCNELNDLIVDNFFKSGEVTKLITGESTSTGSWGTGCPPDIIIALEHMITFSKLTQTNIEKSINGFEGDNR